MDGNSKIRRKKSKQQGFSLVLPSFNEVVIISSKSLLAQSSIPYSNKPRTTTTSWKCADIFDWP